MLFNSPVFLLFFATVFCLYWALKRRGPQNVLLLIASYVFYGTWSWKFLLLLWFSTLLDYSCGRLIEAAQGAARRRAVVILSACVNLAFLGFFKYSGFFVIEAADLLRAVGFQPHIRVLQVVLPVGISFYTFQSLGYVIDVYRRKLSAERNLLDYAVFVAFFPQLVAGPIQRAAHLLPQVKQARSWSGSALESGLQLTAWGLFKKIVIADSLAPFVNAVYASPEHFRGSVLATSTVFFAFQIYCDFSGYSDIARGTARMLGFDVIRNFDLPYFSRNPVEFWRRWHISLSQWFQDYLYFPLAMHYMRKGGAAHKYRAHIISMGLIGLWHGANWTFVVFGLYWGVAIAGYLYIQERLATGAASWVANLEGSVIARRAGATLGVACTLLIAFTGWIFFRASTLGDAWTVISRLFASSGLSAPVGADIPDARVLWTMVLGLWAVELVYRSQSVLVQIAMGGELRRLAWRYALICAIVFSYSAVQQGRVQPFIYFQF